MKKTQHILVVCCVLALFEVILNIEFTGEKAEKAACIILKMIQAALNPKEFCIHFRFIQGNLFLCMIFDSFSF